MKRDFAISAYRAARAGLRKQEPQIHPRDHYYSSEIRMHIASMLTPWKGMTWKLQTPVRVKYCSRPANGDSDMKKNVSKIPYADDVWLIPDSVRLHVMVQPYRFRSSFRPALIIATSQCSKLPHSISRAEHLSGYHAATVRYWRSL